MFARRPARGFTLVELMTVIAILAILMALLIPALGGAKSSTLRTQCQYNLHHLGIALQGYAAQYNGWWPSRSWSQPHTVGQGAPENYVWYYWFAAEGYSPSILTCPVTGRNESEARAYWETRKNNNYLGMSYEITIGTRAMGGLPAVYYGYWLNDTRQSILGSQVGNWGRRDTTPGHAMIAGDNMWFWPAANQYGMAGWNGNHMTVRENYRYPLGRNALMGDFSVEWQDMSRFDPYPYYYCYDVEVHHLPLRRW